MNDDDHFNQLYEVALREFRGLQDTLESNIRSVCGSPPSPIRVYVRGAPVPVDILRAERRGRFGPNDRVNDVGRCYVVARTIGECYDVLGRLHTRWRAVPSRLVDNLASSNDRLGRFLETMVVGPQRYRLSIRITPASLFRINIPAELEDDPFTAVNELQRKLDELVRMLDALDVPAGIGHNSPPEVLGEDPENLLEQVRKEAREAIALLDDPSGIVESLPKTAERMERIANALEAAVKSGLEAAAPAFGESFGALLGEGAAGIVLIGVMIGLIRLIGADIIELAIKLLPFMS